MEIVFSLLIASAMTVLSNASRIFSSSSTSVDVESLLAFRRSISHDPSGILRDWNNELRNSSHHFHCNWSGITCSSRHPGRVASLNLTQYSLQGTISPHIGNLSFLSYLNLSSNAFTGVIPPTIGGLRRLRVLELSSNSLGGILPPQLGSLKNLQVIYAYSNALTGTIPPSLLNCSNLKELGLSDNNLTGNIPKCIGSLTKLTFLNVANNSLAGNIEESIQNLTSLIVLDLSDNQFRGMLPSWIGLLSNLEMLLLDNNNFNSIPEGIVNCSSLGILSITNNNLHGTLPSSLGLLANIEELYLFQNYLKGSIPESLCNARKLRIIAIGENYLQGSVPFCFGRLSALERLSAHDNYIESRIRSFNESIHFLKALSNCSKLYNVDLANNNLQGWLPNVLPKHLESLNLSGNRISGNIPPTIGNLSKLTNLALYSNSFKGSIPTTIACLKSLHNLDLSYNLLEGTIPEEMRTLNKTLEYIDLSSNHLIGSIPKSIGQFAILRRLTLSNNSFSGRIPHELGNCLSLEHLQLSFNNLSGDIPREVANLRNIQFGFDLSNNKLSGTIPPEIGGLQMASYIDISNNHLSGKIGLYMSAWLNAQYINMSFNSFSGRLSDSFGAKQTFLNVIDLSRNNFSGGVPPALYNLSALEFLNFSHNNLEGSITCTGPFKKLNHSSFLHNSLLCGKCMGLPLCKDTSTRHSHFLFYKAQWFIITLVVFGLSCMIASSYLLFSKEKMLNTEEPMDDVFRAVSKEELVRATNNLSDANLIGAGSYGAVYSGVLQSGEMVAVKIFNSVNQQRSNASFFTECRTLGKVRHRNLIKIITVCCEDNFRALVLPLMVKGSLHDLLHERDIEGFLPLITMELCMNIISELAGALSYLHHDCTPSIVHCDVKPENVLLDIGMTLKLTDFGIAKIMGDSLASTTLSLKGSVGYIAPEYGVGEDMTSKADVYSFGIVVLEVMTRRKPTDDMFNDNMSMLEWVSLAFAEEDKKRENIRSVVQILNPSEEDSKRIERVMKLGIICCNEDPRRRPTMREVENLLYKFGERERISNPED